MSRNRCSTECCGHILSMADAVGSILTCHGYLVEIGRVQENIYNSIEDFGYHDKPGGTRIIRLVCPLCASLYAGWLRWNVLDGEWLQDEKRWVGAWELYDTSYWYSFNDEPDNKGRDSPVEHHAIWAERLFIDLRYMAKRLREELTDVPKGKGGEDE